MAESNSELTEAELREAGLQPEGQRGFRKGLLTGLGFGLGTGAIVFVLVALAVVAAVSGFAWELFSLFIDAAWGH